MEQLRAFLDAESVIHHSCAQADVSAVGSRG
jgi:hypothetical protein